ncbi:MAG: signal peptidase I [Clostridia bacterium]|nr:signal peptidase I [Clostridia bacterium]
MKQTMESMNPLSSERDIINQRRGRILKRYETRSSLTGTVVLLMIVAAIVIIFSLIFGLKIISGNDMYPAFRDGDLVLTYFRPSFIKNEVVIYKAGGAEHCGRIVAKGGDTVDFSAEGRLLVNGVAQTSDVVFPTAAPEGWEGPVTVPADAVYVLGDYRTQAADSRLFGFVYTKDIGAKVIALLRHMTL